MGMFQLKFGYVQLGSRIEVAYLTSNECLPHLQPHQMSIHRHLLAPMHKINWRM